MEKDHIIHLFTKRYSGNLNAEEEALFHEMMHNPALQSIVEEAIGEVLEHPRENRRLSIDRENDILSGILIPQRKIQGPTAIRRLHIRRWGLVAASIILILSVAIYLRVGQKPATEQVIAGSSYILPGKNGAILTLSDGSQVSLDTFKNATVALQGGVTAKVVNGALIYEGKGDVAAYNTMTTPNGRQFQVMLPDGTRVWLNAASSIRYPTIFTGSQRLVEITGEAYFEVAKNKKMPFHVEVDGRASVEVTGTQFNVNAYRNEASIRTTLLEGAVIVADVSTNAKATLHPGEQARLASGNIQVIREVAVDKVVAWKKGLFNFEGLSFAEITRELERWYNIEIIFEGNMPDKTLWGGMSKDVPLSGVLQYFKGLDIKYRQEGRRLFIMP